MSFSQKEETAEEKAKRLASEYVWYQRRMMTVPQRLDLIEDKLNRIEQMIQELLTVSRRP